MGAGGGYGFGKWTSDGWTALIVMDSTEPHRETPIQRTAATAPERRGGGRGVGLKSQTYQHSQEMLRSWGMKGSIQR